MLAAMIRSALAVLLAALATACASAVGFADAPAIHQLVLLVLACVFGAGLQVVAAVQKKAFSTALIVVGPGRISRVPWISGAAR
jgi:formate/nitrite transporter FocA (FNT family)